VYAEAVELWVEGESRIHDRARWVRQLQWTDLDAPPASAGEWRATRLQP
jgi:pyridoxine/pyridoxamine 5'-phosphate oxidase